jgi:hypothetical protein
MDCSFRPKIRKSTQVRLFKIEKQEKKEKIYQLLKNYLLILKINFPRSELKRMGKKEYY